MTALDETPSTLQHRDHVHVSFMADVPDPRLDAAVQWMTYDGEAEDETQTLRSDMAELLATIDAADAAVGIERLTARDRGAERLTGAAQHRALSEDLLADWGPIIEAMVEWRTARALAVRAEMLPLPVARERWDAMRTAGNRFAELADAYVAEYGDPIEAGQ